MTNDLFELRVLVKNREIPKYFHQDQTYVCGFNNTEFELELCNHSDELVLMIPSVDGLSIIDGKEASENSQGYLVCPKSSVKIPGWALDENSVAKFVFADKKKSYAAIHPETPSENNVGVLGVIVYSQKKNEKDKFDEIIKKIKELEKQKPIIINPIQPWYPWYNPYYDNRPYNPYHPVPIWCGQMTCGSTTGGVGTSNIGLLNSSFSANANLDTNIQSLEGSTNYSITNVSPLKVEEDFSLGVGFGEKTEFKHNNNLSFERDTIIATLVIYYDSRKNLEKRGIIISKPKEEKKVPNPFPKMGCQPPIGWVGKS